MATLSRTLIRRLIRMGSYLFLAAIVAFTSFVGLGRKDKHTLDYSLSNNVNVAHADTPHDGGGDIGGGADADGGGDGGADGAGGGGGGAGDDDGPGDR